MEEQPADTQAPVRVPFSTVIVSIIGLWLCYFVLASLRAQLLDLGFELDMLWRRGIVALVGVAVTVGMWLILRLFDGKALWIKVTAALVIAMPVAVVLAQANQMIFADMADKIMLRMAERQGVKIRRDESGNLLVDVPVPPVPSPPPVPKVPEAPAAPAPASPTSADVSPEEEIPAAEPVTINGPDEAYTKAQQISDIALSRYFLMLAWCALYLAMIAGEQARAAERREGTFRRAAKAAELRSLRYQVNPHFLFNTLNSLSALVLTGKTERAEAMIQMISTFYRRSLADDPTADVPLAQEFALQKLYLDIEGVRFPDRLRAVYDLPEDLEDAKVPGMILQPLVENSVKHAVAPYAEKVTITLAAREDFGRLLITVSDDCRKCTPKSAHGAQRQGYGIGLANVRERLGARFGDQASISSAKTEDGYVTQIRIPLVKQ